MGSPKLGTKVLRWILGRMKVQAISILCIITIQGFALISGDDCQDRISFRRCERIAARDKCDKPWAAKKCAETCGYCDEDYCGDVFPTKKCERWNKRGKCNWAVAQFLCKKTCGYCEDDEDTPTTMAPPEPTTGTPTNPPSTTGGPDPPSPTDEPTNPPSTEGPTTDAPSPPTTEAPSTQTEGPTTTTEIPDLSDIVACTSASGCECGDSSKGFQTYTFTQNNQQRCFTIFHPLSRQNEVLPVMFSPNCYAEDRLQGLNGVNPNTNVNKAADRFGYARVLVSTPDRNWVFGNDQIVNDDKPMPCADEDSKDIAYIRKIMNWIKAHPGQFDSSMIYANGFSQNSMFSAYIGFCFNENFKGVWQAGSGMTLKGKSPYVPNCGGQLAASTFAQCGGPCRQCIQQYTCEDCQYWPIYPCYSPKHPIAHCIAEYTNDPISVGQEDTEAFSTSRNMYERSRNEGHEARLLRFDKSTDGTIAGTHKNVQNLEYWVAGCLGITQPCSTQCENAFMACVDSENASSAMDKANAFGTCIASSKFAALNGCSTECAPTYKMLVKSEEPSTAEGLGNNDTFTPASGQASSRPGDSRCSQ